MKRKRVLIILGIIVGVTTLLLGSLSIKKIDKEEVKLDTTTSLLENKIHQDKVKIVEKDIKAFELMPEIGSDLNYEKIGDYSFLSNILFKDNYSDLEGILTFRGNNLRNSATYGISSIKEKKLNIKWKYTTSSSSWGGGAGWTGQPSIVRWPNELKKKMNIYEEFKKEDNFTEVIYSSLDGNIYFLDLNSGKASREEINVGNPIKGSLSIDSRGIPLLYTGEGVNESGITGFNIYSLIDGSNLYEINGYDSDALRGWSAFDSSPLVYSEGDIVIEGGENGLLYVIKLNTEYNKEEGIISINPEVFKYRYYVGDDYGRLGIENSVAIYANLLYFADNSGDIQCIDLREMEPKWIFPGGDDIDASITIESEEGVPFIYIGNEVDHQGESGISTIRKINGLTGEEVWKKEFSCQSVVGADAINGGVLSTNVIGKNNISDLVIFSVARYNGFNSGSIIAMNKKNGDIVWERKIDNYMWSSPVDFYDKNGNGYIIQCDSIGNMYLLDGENGEILNKLKLDSNIEASPAIFEDTIVVATRDGNIYGIEVK